MNEQALRFRFGIFVLGSLILLAILIILFGGFPSAFKKTDTYTIEFDNAHGVAPGTPVRRSGVRIGEARNVTLDDNTGKVRVEIRVDHRYTLHKGDRPTIVQGLLGGDAAIAFLPPEKGFEDKTPVPPDAVLRGYTPTDAGALVQKAGDLVTPATEALNEVKKVFERFDKMGPTLEEAIKDFSKISKSAARMTPTMEEMMKDLSQLSRTATKLSPELEKTNAEIQKAAANWAKVGERAEAFLKANEDKIGKSLDRLEESLKRVNEFMSDENQKNITAILKNTRHASDQFDSITKNADALMRESRVTVKQLNDTMRRADDVLGDLQKTLKPFGDKGPQMFKNLDESADNLNKTLKDLRELVHVVARNDGTVQKLLSDPSLYNNLNDSAVMATKIMPRLDRILRDVEIFADKLARHPELIGIGGVIRPSSGLKEPPFRIYP